MRVRTGIVEFDSKEAAEILGISEEELIDAISRGDFGFYYRTKRGYQFHEASIAENRERLKENGKESDQLAWPGMEE